MAMTAGKRRILFLGLALGMAAAAAGLVKVYLDKKTAELEARYADTTEKAAIVVPKVNLPVGSRVTIENFAIRRMPVDMIPPDAIVPADIARAEGQSLKVALPLGRPLLWGYLSSGTSPSFSDMLDENKRALTIAVDELNSISGMIRPYDRIDLFIVSKEKLPGSSERNSKESKVVMPLLQDVLVKATGNIVRRETSADGREIDRRYSTLTLDLLPEEIGRVLIAQENGELKAALKRPEQNVIDYKPTRESDLWPTKPDEALTTGGVVMYIGGKGGTLTPQMQPYPKEEIDTVATLGDGTFGAPPTLSKRQRMTPQDEEEMRALIANGGASHSDTTPPLAMTTPSAAALPAGRGMR